jgi:uncharacterized BrkB/YihY/UPF0761 family membrane protein
MPAKNYAADAQARDGQLLERLRRSRWAPLVAVVERFIEIDGGTQSGLVSLQFFTTVIPLLIIGFAFFSGFAKSASLGDLLTRLLGLHPPLDTRVREAFGDAAALQSLWSLVGIAGFLLAGVPMSITVAAMFARAWRRRQLGTVEKLARGAAWFVLYLGTTFTRERIGYGGQYSLGVHAALLIVALVPQWAFWSLTPVLLVRDGGRGWRLLLLAGCAGVAIDGVILAAGARVMFPVLLEGWSGFGSMGVAMALMTWCGVIATGWVVIACVGAIAWERNAPARTVIQLRTAAPDPSAATS